MKNEKICNNDNEMWKIIMVIIMINNMKIITEMAIMNNEMMRKMT